jgi:acetamidase/formamidase
MQMSQSCMGLHQGDGEVCLTTVEAYSLCSMAADVRITQVVNIKKGVHVMIPRDLLNQKAREA